MKTILVSFPEGVNAIIEKELIGKIGGNKSEVVRTLVVAQLMQLGYIRKGEKMSKKIDRKKMEEIDLLDNMLTSLVDLLEEKGVLTHEEWNTKIRQKIESKKKLVSFRDLEGE